MGVVLAGPSALDEMGEAEEKAWMETEPAGARRGGASWMGNTPVQQSPGPRRSNKEICERSVLLFPAGGGHGGWDWTGQSPHGEQIMDRLSLEKPKC